VRDANFEAPEVLWVLQTREEEWTEVYGRDFGFLFDRLRDCVWGGVISLWLYQLLECMP
jgi:hypothetical protein